ncbi:MAG: hypothetical protein PUP91_21140 [Rhizonema sp. PD37]|nr:hypothetical protein [Rhizonema sp. PD37]
MWKELDVLLPFTLDKAFSFQGDVRTVKHEILTIIVKNCITPGDGQQVYDLMRSPILYFLLSRLRFFYGLC